MRRFSLFLCCYRRPHLWLSQMTVIHKRSWWPSNFVKDTVDRGQQDDTHLKACVTNRDVFDLIWHVQTQATEQMEQAGLFCGILKLVLRDVPEDTWAHKRLYERARQQWFRPATSQRKASGYQTIRNDIVIKKGKWIDYDDKVNDVLAEALAIPFYANAGNKTVRPCTLHSRSGTV